MRRVEDRHWWFRARRRFLTRALRRLPLAVEARILEVGCGTGGNLAMLQALGLLEAIEPDAEARDYAAGRSGIPISDGLLPDGLPEFGHRFDLICALDVIEHVDRDAETVRALSGRLAPGGWLVATVPAYAWMWSEHDRLHHHKRRYRIAAFRALFVAAGLEVHYTSYFNTFLFPLIAAARLAERITGRAAHGDALPSPVVNGLLEFVFNLESRIAPPIALPFGVSIVVIARAPISSET